MDISKITDHGKITETKVGGATASKSRSVKGDEGTDKKISGTELSSGLNSSENVKWSDDAQVANEAVALAKATPVDGARAERLALLKASIKNGSYKPDAHKIADKMIQSSLEEDLLTRKA